jgi:hypothetical protein
VIQCPLLSQSIPTAPLALRIIAAHVQHMHQTICAARDRFVALDARKLPFIRPVAIKLPSLDHLHRAQRAHDITGQPDLTVPSTPNGPEQRVVMDVGGGIQNATLKPWPEPRMKRAARIIS